MSRKPIGGVTPSTIRVAAQHAARFQTRASLRQWATGLGSCLTNTPACVPQTTFRPCFSTAHESNSSSCGSERCVDFNESVLLPAPKRRSSVALKRPSPPVLNRVAEPWELPSAVGGPVETCRSDTKSSCTVSSAHAFVGARRSHIRTTPSSSPLAKSAGCIEGSPLAVPSATSVLAAAPWCAAAKPQVSRPSGSRARKAPAESASMRASPVWGRAEGLTRVVRCSDAQARGSTRGRKLERAARGSAFGARGEAE